MPLSNEGYTIPRLAEVIESLKTKAVEVFQDLVPEGEVVNVGDNSALGRIIGIISPALSDSWEASQQVYDAFNINAATGISLDNLCALGGVARQPASSTITSVLLTGSPGTSIASGSKMTDVRTGNFHSLLETVVLDYNNTTSATFSVLTVANSTDYTISYRKNPDTLGDGFVSVTITSDGSATGAEILTALETAINTAPHNAVLVASVVNSTLVVSTLDYTSRVDFTFTSNLNIDKVSKPSTVSCDTTGPVEIPVNSITRISIPLIGWDSVTNPLSGIQGTNRETDSELRARYKVAKFGDGSNLTESIYSAIYAIDGVESVRIIENDTDTALISPSPLVPAHSFYTIVLGGASQDIGQAIWNNKPLGIGTFGSNTVTVYDSQGVAKTIKFDRPSAVDVYVDVSITVDTDFPADGVDQIKQAVASHINSLLIGDDVVYSRLYTPINSVTGHYVNTLEVGTSPSPTGTTNVSIAYHEKAAVSVDNIIVSTV